MMPKTERTTEVEVLYVDRVRVDTHITPNKYYPPGDSTASLPIIDYPNFGGILADIEPLKFEEAKECNEGERVICKSTSTRRHMRSLSNKSGYKARKEYWR